MATKTRSDLVSEALDALGVLAAGQTPAVEDTDKINDKLPALAAEFAAREVVYVPDIDNIPLPWFAALADMVAYECADSFGVIGDAADRLKQKNDEAILKFRTMLRGRPTYKTVQNDFM